MLPNTKIKVLIIDDSAFMRKSLTLMLQSDDSIEIIGTARDGEEGYNLVKIKRPDVVTLDIEMPKMDGLTALEKIMKDCPTPVLMVSSLTVEGADATLKALELGAVDFIPKGMSYVNMDIVKIKEDLVSKVKSIAKRKSLRETLARLRSLTSKRTDTSAATQNFITTNKKLNYNYKAIAIGISTGGPLSLQKFLPCISEKVTQPIFIVQHMPPMFTKSLAERLNSMCSQTVKEGEDGEIVQNSFMYIAPGGKHMTVQKKSLSQFVIKTSECPNDTLHRPSVDVMMDSVADIYQDRTLGIIMTGMGHDGTEGIRKIKKLGGQCIGQDEDSCIVYGMPKSVADAGLVDVVSPLDKIADLLNYGA
jgi:two-component system, chemotaxis family, protein-glutamate methylesterase/glutaminase